MVSISEYTRELLIVVSTGFFVAVGAWMLDYLMNAGQLLERWGNFVDEKKWCYPLGGCVLCTAFWWGWLFGGLATMNIVHGLATGLFSAYIIRRHLYA